MRSLVLGGNGFMGVHLVGRLAEDGHTVRVYVRSPNRFRALPRGVEYVEGELGWKPYKELGEGIVRTWGWIYSLSGIRVES